MASVDTTLTNTILIPASDGLASNSLAGTTVVSDLEKFNTNFEKKSTILGNQFKVYIKSGDKNVHAAFCESVNRLEIHRNVQAQRVGGNDAYTAALPGSLTYGPVIFVHLVTENEAFLNWLINGLNYGGIQKADIEIRVGDDDDYMVYTLRDAFPIKWDFGTMGVNLEGLVLNKEVITYTLKKGEMLVENLEVVYGKIEYSHVGQ